MRKLKKRLTALFFSAVLAGELTVLGDLTAAWLGVDVQRGAFFGSFALLALLFFCLPRITNKHRIAAAVGVPAAVAVTAAACFLLWKDFSADAVYRDVDSGKEQMYADRRVMLIVPHEDDEINVLGGVLEEYVKYGSQVYPVFVTNGDYEGLAETRFAEALAAAQYIGIPEENVIFLGYGDQWKEGGAHLYNAEPGEVMESHIGNRQTYGTSLHAAYREGRDYTVDNLMEDLHDLILEYRPDTIFCSDYDIHIDHKATTLVFEKVMGTILKEVPDYRPTVYKGYAYSAAWYSVPDYYETNILSTCNVFAEPLYQQPAVYRWEDRVRLPVSAGALSRSMYSSGVYHTLSLHASQNAIEKASRVINGDRVVWERETESLCYSAVIETSSSTAAVLNDFMLIENHDLVREDHMPYDGVWSPAAEDTEKCVTVTFPEPVDISHIVLYDHPSKEENVLNAVIRFDDGSQIPTGPLDPGGAATRIPVEKRQVTAFTVTLEETEGEQAGLTELEAFREAYRADHSCIKLMDENGNFVYDYWLEPDGEAQLGLYAYGADTESCTVSCDNTRCQAVLENGALKVTCPTGESAVITVTCRETGVSDSIRVSNPGALRRLRCRLGQWMEEHIFQKYLDGQHRLSVTYELLDILRYRLKSLM